MIRDARRITATVIALTLAVGLLGSAPVLAQAEEEPGINADRVDYRDAVGATASRAERAKNLVATNREGRLPSNILEPLWKLMRGIPAAFADGQISWAELVGVPGDLADGKIGWAEIVNKPADIANGKVPWGDVTNKPADLADGQIGWGEVTGIPAGFADGVDDGKFVSQVFGPFNTPLAPGGIIAIGFAFPGNADVDINVIPMGGQVSFRRAVEALPGGEINHWVILSLDALLLNVAPPAPQVKIRVRLYSEGIAPAALRKQLKNVEVKVLKAGNKKRR